MTQEKAIKLQKQMNALMENEEFSQKLMRAENEEQVLRIMNENGIDVTLEEVRELGAVCDEFAQTLMNPETGELSDEALEMVAGGLNLFKIAAKTWNYGTKISGLYWGSQSKAKKATVSFWGNALTKGWNYACKNVHNY